MSLPADPLLAAALPDVPRWIHARALLLSGQGVVHRNARGDAAVVVKRDLLLATLVGNADAALLRDALAGVAEDCELLVQLSELDEARSALAGWESSVGVLHVADPPYRADVQHDAGVEVSSPPDPCRVTELPPGIRRYVESASAMAVRITVDGVAAVCAAEAVTGTLWDVSVDTLERHRRRGHAAACFRALAAHMAAEGRQPVWGSEETNVASMRLAAKLGFRPVDRLAILSPP